MLSGKRFLKRSIVSLLIGLSTICMNPASLSAEENPATQTILYNKGMDLVALLSEMASSDIYNSMRYPQGEILDLVKMIGSQDHTTPVSVSQIQTDFDALMQAVGSADQVQQLPENVLNHLKKGIITSLPTMLDTQQNNMTIIAASSLCKAGKTFVAEGLTESTMYLYVFDAAVPVFVTFVPGDDNSVSASASFVILDETASPADAEDVKALFQTAGIQAEFSEISLPAGD